MKCNQRIRNGEKRSSIQRRDYTVEKNGPSAESGQTEHPSGIAFSNEPLPCRHQRKRVEVGYGAGGNEGGFEREAATRHGSIFADVKREREMPVGTDNAVNPVESRGDI